jgi:hypothetical protein
MPRWTSHNVPDRATVAAHTRIIQHGTPLLPEVACEADRSIRSGSPGLHGRIGNDGVDLGCRPRVPLPLYKDVHGGTIGWSRYFGALTEVTTLIATLCDGNLGECVG